MQTHTAGERPVSRLVPEILTDKSRLQEIYDLRVLAYEHSHKAEYVNRERFPNGWKDRLDERDETIHWVIEYDNKIVAAARLAILNDITEIDENFSSFALPDGRPFAYWSRLVTHPEFRHHNISTLLDNIRKEYLDSHSEISFAICCVTPERIDAINNVGFRFLGDFEYDWGGGITNTQSLLIYFITTQF